MMISSSKNPKVKEFAQLRESRHRRESGLFAIEGARELKRALQAGYACRTLYFAKKILSAEAQDLLASLPLKMHFELTEDVFQKLAVRESSDGLLAVMEARPWTFDAIRDVQDPFLLVLENVEKPGNFGALARSADGAGVQAMVILDPQADLFNPHAVRASVGSVFSFPLIACTHEQFHAYCQQKKMRIVTASPHAKNDHFQENLKGPLALVMGSEAWGLSDIWRDIEHVSVKIPMMGVADSLNVSVAGAVLLYEALRQRKTPEPV